MDELIARMRSQATHPSYSGEEPVVVTEERVEPPSSQSETVLRNRFRLDFDALKKHREKGIREDNKPIYSVENTAVKIEEIKRSDLLKINSPFWAIVKSIETFKGPETDVYRWELCDETGVIFGSSLVGEGEITVGSIVCLNNFSIWRLGGNHLNIVSRNIKRII